MKKSSALPLCDDTDVYEVHKKFKISSKRKGGIFFFILVHLMDILIALLMVQYLLLAGFP